MNTTGAAILKAVVEFKKLYAQIGLLLKTSDVLMEKNDWEPYGGPCVVGSSALNQTRDWLPSYVFRRYSPAENINRAAFVSIILDDAHNKVPGRVTEPLVSAGWYEWEERSGIVEAKWTCRHLLFSGWPDNGNFSIMTDKTKLKYDKHKVTRFSSCAIPLVSILNSSDLERRLIQPLLAHIKENT